MPITTLTYHDVTAPGRADASGFPGRDAGRYKLAWPEFLEHLAAIAQATSTAPVTARDVLDGRAASGWSLTFDDGGASMVEVGAELAERGWRGQFFITTNCIGTRGFLGADEIRALHDMGHVVGSHSATHPQRMSVRTPAELQLEWRTSIAVLAELLGEAPAIAAVPGGWYTKKVGRTAAAAGLRALYTSQPVRRAASVDGCLVLGRFAVLGGATPADAAGLAAGSVLPRARRRAVSLALSPVKRVGGTPYLRVRKALLRLDDD